MGMAKHSSWSSRFRQTDDPVLKGRPPKMAPMKVKASWFGQNPTGTKRAGLQGMLDDEFDNAPLDTILTLPSGMSAADISSACREAGLEFINDSRRWGKPELSMWLTARYAELTKHAVKEEGGAGLWPVPLLKDIDVRLVDRIMATARAEILETLHTIAKDGAASFVLKALISGSVVRCEDASNQPMWAPGQATRLADRVLSLFATDYLTRPGDYEGELFVCRECESVAFDEETRRRDVCPNHSAPSMASGVRRPTLPFPPMGA